MHGAGGTSDSSGSAFTPPTQFFNEDLRFQVKVPSISARGLLCISISMAALVKHPISYLCQAFDKQSRAAEALYGLILHGQLQDGSCVARCSWH